ncbi:glucose-1-phosphate cytidylyltransferase [Candidatus Latescibacterota bacterium]
MKTIILCGGEGTRLKEETEFKPKPMVEIGGKPILWHIMKIYAHFGFKEFILALGYKGNIIRDFFLNYEFYNNDFTITLGNHNDIVVHDNTDESGWKITLVETGSKTMTGSRIKKCEKYIKENNFMVTYGDGLANVDIAQIVEFHKNHGKIGTLTGINLPSRFGELHVEGNRVIEFSEKSKLEGTIGNINGGFMVFKKGMFGYLLEDNGCVLEREPLEKLSQKNNLMVYHHDDYWQCMDNYRDYLLLQEIWNSGNVPWQFE